MVEVDFKPRNPKECSIRSGILELGRKIKTFKHTTIEGIFKRKKFTKEELEQAEEAWIRG